MLNGSQAQAAHTTHYKTNTVYAISLSVCIHLQQGFFYIYIYICIYICIDAVTAHKLINTKTVLAKTQASLATAKAFMEPQGPSALHHIQAATQP